MQVVLVVMAEAMGEVVDGLGSDVLEQPVLAEQPLEERALA